MAMSGWLGAGKTICPRVCLKTTANPRGSTPRIATFLFHIIAISEM